MARLKVVGTLGQDKLWRRATDALPPPPKQAVPDSQNPLLGTREPGGGGSGGSGQWEPGRNRYGNRFPPYRGTAYGNRFREPPTGTGCKCENTPPPSPQGGCSEQAVVKHEKSCPKCFGKGLDAFGKAL